MKRPKIIADALCRVIKIPDAIACDVTRRWSNSFSCYNCFQREPCDSTYDPQIGLFVSPDTIVPDAGNVFGYNRMMYTFGNPMKFVDPSGHDPCDKWGQNCQDSAPLTPSPAIPLEVAQYLFYQFNYLNTPDSYTWEMFYSDLVNAVEAAGGYNDQTYMQVVHNMANTLTGNFGGDSALTEGVLLQVILPSDMLGAAVAQEHDQRVGESATAAAMIGGTYKLMDGDEVVYVGRTKNLHQRANQWAKDPNKQQYDFDIDLESDDYFVQRGREQQLYDEFNPALNKIRPIRVGNPNYDSYINAANGAKPK